MSKRVLQGIVVSDTCDKTVIVRIERRVIHPVYKKFVTHSKKYTVHDEHNSFHTGDLVQIEESRPISKRKHWVVLGGRGDVAPSRRGADVGKAPPVDGAVDLVPEPIANEGDAA